ncbi:Pentatricopeptide repeat (PPR) superfamily protein [Euphorbia peplus]|nr:Pentatricopeptide repeat (PPR) superfamily protein [Euphorbia peplus]
MYTFVSILRSCTTLLNVYFGKQVHAHIIKNSLDANDFVGTVLIDMYAKTGRIEGADVAFHRTMMSTLGVKKNLDVAGQRSTSNMPKQKLCFITSATKKSRNISTITVKDWLLLFPL